MIPKALSLGEETFELHMRTRGITVLREFRFDTTRKWKFDFAFPHQKLAVEIEGGAWSNGRHTRAKGFMEDCRKYNRATALGWRVLRYTTEMVISGEAEREVAAFLKSTF